MEIDTGVAAVTLKVRLPVIPFAVAERVVLPVATDVIEPVELTVATEGAEELQVAAVNKWVVPSE